MLVPKSHQRKRGFDYASFVQVSRQHLNLARLVWLVRFVYFVVEGRISLIKTPSFVPLTNKSFTLDPHPTRVWRLVVAFWT